MLRRLFNKKRNLVFHDKSVRLYEYAQLKLSNDYIITVEIWKRIHSILGKYCETVILF